MTGSFSSNSFAKAFQASSSTPFTLLPVLAGYADEFEFAESDNWDGRGATALTPEVVQLAERLIRSHAGTSYLVEIAPGRDLSLSFVWDDNRGNYVYLDAGPSDTVHLFYDVIGEPKWEGVSVASDPSISEHLARAFRFLHPRNRFPPIAVFVSRASETVRDLIAA